MRERRVIRAARGRVQVLKNLQDDTMAIAAGDAAALIKALQQSMGEASREVQADAGAHQDGLRSLIGSDEAGLGEAERLRDSVANALRPWQRLQVIAGAAMAVLSDPLIGGADLISDAERVEMRSAWERQVRVLRTPAREAIAGADVFAAATLPDAALGAIRIADDIRDGALAEAVWTEGLRTVNGARGVLAEIAIAIEPHGDSGGLARGLVTLSGWAREPDLPDQLGSALRAVLYAAAAMYGPKVAGELQDASGLPPMLGGVTQPPDWVRR